MDNVTALLENTTENIKGKVIDHHVILDVTEPDIHYWSPQLNFRIEPDEENTDQAVISGLIGPRPAVWTLFMFVYFSLGALGLFISFFGFTKMLRGTYSNLVLALPLAILFMLTAYKVGKYGEQLGKDQIELFKQFIRDVIIVE